LNPVRTNEENGNVEDNLHFCKFGDNQSKMKLQQKRWN